MTRLLGVEPLETRRLLSANSGSDDFPNQPSADSCLLSSDSTQRGRIEVAGDRDVFALNVADNKIVTVQVSSPLRQNRIDYWSTDGQEILYTEYGYLSRWRPSTGGQYFVSISSATESGAYELRYSVESDHPDQYDAALPRYEIGQPITGNLQTLHDTDVFPIQLSAEDRLSVVLKRISLNKYPSIAIFQDGGSKFALDISRRARLTFQAPADGTYWLKVSGQVTGEYTLYPELVGDDWPDQLSAESPHLELGVPFVGVNEYDEDVDVFTFDATAGVPLAITSTNQTAVQVQAPNGQSSPRRLSLAYTPGNSGVHTLLVTGSAGPSRSYTVSVTPIEDDFGDEPSSAHTALLNTPVKGSLEYAQDVDAFRLDAPVDQVVKLRVIAPAATTPAVSIVDAAGERIAMPTLQWTQRPGNEYYALVSNRSNGKADYRLVLSSDDASPVPYDDYPDAPGPNVPNITFGQTFEGVLHHQDVDVVGLRMELGEAVRFDGPGSSFPWLRVLDQQGNEMPNRGTSATWDAPATGTYYIEVSGFSDSYSLQPQLQAADDHPDTISDRATNLLVDTPVQVTLDQTSDIDIVSMDVVAGQHHVLNIVRTKGTARHVSLHVLSAQGEQIAESYTGTLNWKPIEDGTYYVQIRANGTGVFELSRQQDGSDDFGDTPANAHTLDTATTIDGVIGNAGDLDLFQYQAVANQFFRVEATPVSTPWRRLKTQVFDANGTLLSPLQTNDGTVLYQSPQNQLVRIQVSQTTRFTHAETYQLFFEPLNEIDQPNHPSGVSTVYRPAETITGSIQYRGDVDIFAFSVVPGALYQPVTLSSTRNVDYAWVSESGDKKTSLNGVPFVHSGSADRMYIQVASQPDAEYNFRLTRTSPDAVLQLGMNQVTSTDRMLTVQVDADEGQLVEIEFSDEAAAIGFIYQVLAPDGRRISTVSREGGMVRFQARAAGPHYVIRTLAGPPASPIAAQLSFPSDDYGDSPASAQLAEFSTNMQGVINHATDQDWFAFDLQKGQAIQLAITPPEYADLLHPTMMSSTGEVLAQSLNWLAETTGRYFARIGHPAEHPTIAGVPPLDYQFQAASVTDDHADTPEQATNLRDANEITGRIDAINDRDMFALHMNAGETWRIDTNAFYRVLGPSGETIPLHQTRPFGQWQAEQSGRYIVEVFMVDMPQAYQIRAIQIATAPTAHQPNESSQDIQPGSNSPGQLAMVDRPFVFAAPEGVAEVRFNISHPSRHRLSIQPPPDQITLMSGDHQAVVPLDADLSWLATEPGSYTLRVEYAQPQPTLELQISPQFPARAPLAPGASIDQAPLYESGQAISVDLANLDGLGYVAVDALRGDILKIPLPGKTPWARPSSVRLYAADGVTELTPGVVEADSFWRIPITGRYFVRLAGRKVFTTSIEVVQGDVPDLPSPASPSLDFTYLNRGEHSSFGDIDVFTIQATAGETFRFRGVRSDNAAHITDADGIHLASLYHATAWTAPESGTYYLESSFHGIPGPYDLQAYSNLRSPTDLNDDGFFTSRDIDNLLSSPRDPFADSKYDINQDDKVDQRDVDAYFSAHNLVMGDANLDGTVGFADFLLLSHHYGQRGNWAMGDFTGERQVDFEDFLILSRQFAR